MCLIRISVLLLLFTITCSSSYPDCSDTSTYSNYTTLYKGVSESLIWDRTRDTSDNCSLDFSPPVAPRTCGDCDFDRLSGDTWYRFMSPYVQIMEYPDSTSCPSIKKCNGFYSLNLVPSSVQGGNANSQYYGLMWRDQGGTCTVPALTDATKMVESYDCTTFLLYRFPSTWGDSAIACNFEHEQGVPLPIYPTPYSLCMYDTVKPLTLEGNRKYYSSSDDTVQCTVSRSPTSPPPVAWTTSDVNADNDVIATLDEDKSGLYTVVYTANTASYSSLSCKCDLEKHDFYKVSIESHNVVSDADVNVTVHCKVFINTSVAQDEDFFFIQSSGSGSDIYHGTSDGSVQVVKHDGGKIGISLLHSATVIPDNVVNVTENWKCAVKDPISKDYITSDFTIVLRKTCEDGFGIAAGESACSECPANTYSKEAVCLPCQDGQISDPGSRSCSPTLQHLLVYIGGGLGGVVVCALLVLGITFGRRYLRGSRYQTSPVIDMTPVFK